MQVWNLLHAARWKYRTQKWCKKLPSEHHRTNLSGYIFATKACIDNQKKVVKDRVKWRHISMVAIRSPFWHHRTNLSGYIFATKATKAHIDNRKKLAKQQYLPHISLQYGELRPTSAGIVSLVWGTPANLSRFRFLAALLHSQTAALSRGRHPYSAGRPSRWALAHISSSRLF